LPEAVSANTTNLHAFEADLGKFAELMDVAPALVLKRVTADLHRRISMRTPVDTGRARASWDVKEGSPSAWIPPETKISVAGKTNVNLGKGLAGNSLGSGAKTNAKMHDVSGPIGSISGKEIVFVTSALDYLSLIHISEPTRPCH
jgi:hypothetical protein